MNNTERPATVIATGKQITVYKLKSGAWCDAVDCTTTYQTHELKFI